MTKAATNKNALHKQREELRLYERVLPSLDLKRLQLKGELQRAKEHLEKVHSQQRRLEESAAESLPMLANLDVEASGLLTVRDVSVAEQNIVGVRLPRLEEVVFAEREYSLLATPHWVDSVIQRLKEMVRGRAAERIAAERVRLLERAERRITQRVNLFEKVLIPEAKENIRKIQIVLADAERSAVVRSKLTKAVRLRQQRSLRGRRIAR